MKLRIDLDRERRKIFSVFNADACSESPLFMRLSSFSQHSMTFSASPARLVSL